MTSGAQRFAQAGARFAAAVVLLVASYAAAVSAVVPWWMTALAAGILVVAVWRPPLALVAAVAVAPWGERLAAVPVRATEILLFAFFAGWALSLRSGTRLRPVRFEAPLLPAVAFAVAVAISWGRLTLDREAGQPIWIALRLVPSDYLVTAGRAPHTAAAVLMLLGIAVYAAALALSRHDAALPRRLFLAVALSGVATAVASVIAVPVVYLQTGDFNEVLRYIVVTTRSRGSFHLQDVNAAGSLYVLAGILALPFAARVAGRARLGWRLAFVALVMGLYMSGSRAAWAAGLAGVATWLAARRYRSGGRALPALSSRALAIAGVAVLAVLTASARLGSASATTGSAEHSLAIRAEFLETSLRMWSTRPILGVGVGTYYERSSEFMPAGIRAIYGRENAHNYYLQIAAELGAAGLALFLWWIGAALARVWHAVQEHSTDGVPIAVLCGSVAYLLTCVTGHPLLVVEAAAPFWAVLGAGVAFALQTEES
jgi:putative inorganic carbon (hco3(-)) transporter